MLLRKAGFLSIILGVFGVMASLFSGYVGIGTTAIHATRWLGVQIGVVLILLGGMILIFQKNNTINIPNVFKAIDNFLLSQSVLGWTLLAFFIAYCLFFIAPVFFDSRLQFQYLQGYLPIDGRLGLDLRDITSQLNSWLLEGKSPYVDTRIFYPPLYNILLAPITLLAYPQSYYFMVVTGVLAYFVSTWVLPTWFDGGKNRALVIFFFGTSIFSYGMQLELERGQYNIITFLFFLFAIYLFHYQKNFRFFSYVFFTLAVQLKVFPLIFILLLIEDWRDWKTNIRRFIGIGVANFLLLFVLGYSTFVDYINSTLSQVVTKGAWAGMTNPSIKSFVYLLGKNDKHGLGLALGNEAALNWVRQNSALLEGILFSYVALCLLVIVIVLYLRREKWFNPYLLLACTMLAMVIPPVSYDYKLVTLAVPMILVFGRLKKMEKPWKNRLVALLIFFAAFSYSITLFSFKYRPGFLGNNLPFLFIILTISVIFLLLDRNHISSPLADSEPGVSNEILEEGLSA